MKPFYINDYPGYDEMKNIIDDRAKMDKIGGISASFVMNEHARKMRVICGM